MRQLRHLANMRVEEDKLFSNGMLIVVEWFIHSDGGLFSEVLDFSITNGKEKNKLYQMQALRTIKFIQQRLRPGRFTRDAKR